MEAAATTAGRRTAGRTPCVWRALAGWCIVAVALVLRPLGWRALDAPGIGVLPDTSPFHHLTGLPGPTCGLTRSFVNMAHGHLSDAFLAHFLGPAVFIAAVGLTGYYTYRALGGRRRLAVPARYPRALSGSRVVWAVVALFLASWAAKLYWGVY